MFVRAAGKLSFAPVRAGRSGRKNAPLSLHWREESNRGRSRMTSLTELVALSSFRGREKEVGGGAGGRGRAERGAGVEGAC